MSSYFFIPSLHTLIHLLIYLALLVPEYHSYTRACVQHSSNSTYISRNLYSAAVNYAAMDGNGEVLKGIAEYNAKVEEYCTTNVASTLITYNNMFDQLYKYNTTLSVSTYCIVLQSSLSSPLSISYLSSSSLSSLLLLSSSSSSSSVSLIARCYLHPTLSHPIVSHTYTCMYLCI